MRNKYTRNLSRVDEYKRRMRIIINKEYIEALKRDWDNLANRFEYTPPIKTSYMCAITEPKRWWEFWK